MAQTQAELETRLTEVREAISAILTGRVAEFEHEGGDRARMLDLAQLRQLEEMLIKQLAAAKRRAGRFYKIYPIAGLLLAVTITTEAGVARRTKATLPAYVGAQITRFNSDFQPPHRSGDSATRDSWDLLTRRVRWMADNVPLMRRLVDLLCQHVVGEGITPLSAATDHLAPDVANLVTDPLWVYSDESDRWFERWAENWADVERQKTLWELQHLSGRDLFASGNSLWLECRKKTDDGSAPLCYQLLEAEQLDRGRDRMQAPGQTRISNGIEYDDTGEPIAYWLYDAHPYDDLAGMGQAGKSRPVPAWRITHLYLPSRASQHFGVSLGNAALQSVRDADWLVGHELTAAALAAGLTLLIKEGDLGAELSMDGDDTSLIPTDDDGIPYLSEVGLASGTAARIGKHESVEIVESKRPNRAVEPFVKFIERLVSMAGNVSWHRYTGDPTGASFATLRAMINDDRAMSLRLTQSLGRRIAAKPRVTFDRLQIAAGKYSTVTPAEYLRRPYVYQDLDVLGPPLRHLNPVEDVQAAKDRISGGLSTLRIECGLLGLSYRRVMRQLAVERDLARALRIVLDFGSGGGGRPEKITTDETAAAG